MLRWFVLFACLAVSIWTEAKPFLFLTKVGGRFQLKVHIGEPLRLKLVDANDFTYGIVEGFSSAGIYIHGVEIPLSEVESIDLRDKNFGTWSFRSSPGKLISAGIILWFADLVNESEGVSSEITFVSSGLVVSGIAMILFRRKYFVPGDKYKIQVIGLS